ncbi:MAG: type II toxin-antitoxin system ParD family antitoxin [Gammaproteobacteria bacterium]|nr:type II toxin-antitoxin system ParD family antitoxin [Gammaproteobacteria bacterium]
MAKNTSMTLGDHFDGFIAGQIDSGRFNSASEVVRAALRMLENNEAKLNTLRKALDDGEKSGISDYEYNAFMVELDSEINE